MTEAERQQILSKAKQFFKTRIAENHIANTRKLSSLDKFNINPFTHKYLAPSYIREFLEHQYPQHLVHNFSIFVMKFFHHMLRQHQELI